MTTHCEMQQCMPLHKSFELTTRLIRSCWEVAWFVEWLVGLVVLANQGNHFQNLIVMLQGIIVGDGDRHAKKKEGQVWDIMSTNRCTVYSINHWNFSWIWTRIQFVHHKLTQYCYTKSQIDWQWHLSTRCWITLPSMSLASTEWSWSRLARNEMLEKEFDTVLNVHIGTVVMTYDFSVNADFSSTDTFTTTSNSRTHQQHHRYIQQTWLDEIAARFSPPVLVSPCWMPKQRGQHTTLHPDHPILSLTQCTM